MTMKTKLFVGNLSSRVTEAGLRFLFSKQGEISAIKVTVERTTGRSRAFAIVTMATAEGAQAAVQSLHRQIWNGRHITVNEVGPKEDSGLDSLPSESRLSIGPQQTITPFFPIKAKAGVSN
jgi:RNA recognition motif-containing protein